MIATSTQPGMFPVVPASNPLTLVHTLPPPGSTTVSAQSLGTLPSTSGLEVIPVIPETPSNGKKAYPCSYCDKTFGSRYNASRHEKGCKMAPPGSGGNQTNVEPILCPKCGKQFQTHDGMTRHLKKKCKMGPPYAETPQRWTGKKVHMCKYCGKHFSTKWNAIRHENLFHTSDEPPLTSLMVVPVQQPPEQQYTPRKPERFCRFCGNYFSTKYNAIRHERICTRISSSAISQNVSTTTTETKSVVATPLVQSHVTTVQIQPPPQQNVTTPQLQQQVVLQRQQQTQPQQQHSHSQAQQNQLQIQQLQVQQQLQQQVQQQQQLQQQHEAQQNHQQQQIIAQQQAQHHIQQHQQTAQQSIAHQHQQTQAQQVHITPQQFVFVQPYHVCKFCNKQLDTKCDPTPILREDLQNGTINAASLQAASLQVQTPITPTIITGVSLPMIATIPAHNITIPIQPQTPQRNPNPQSIVTPHQTQQVQQVQVQIQPQQATPQQPQQMQQQPPQMQPPPTPQQQPQPPQTPQQGQQPPRASPVQTVQQKPHGCKFCNKHFATKWYLDQHEKIHTGQAVTCGICSKSFVTRWHLDKHARVHLPGGKKAKRESVQTPVESRYRNPSIITISESTDTTQQNSINGGHGQQEEIVVAVPSFSISDNRTQLQQFGLSPLTQQEQAEK